MDAHSSSRDKRTTPRYSARGVAARLSWRIGDADQTLDVELIDISMGGLAAVAPALPPGVSRLWINLRGAPVAERVEVSLVSARRTRVLFVLKRNYILRMKFTDGCTFDLFKNAIRGFAHDIVSGAPAADDLKWFNSQSWR